MLLCQHEKIAVQIAHGYARAKGKPMIAIVHNLVGLLHAPMGVYYAYLDRAPVFIIGATGPMAEPKRRPFIDWIHTANGQGEAIRNFVKWDYQPTTVDGVPGAFARAYSVMMSARQGPVYMVYDAGLQEAELTYDVEMPPAGAIDVPTAPSADPVALAKAADTLAAANRVAIIADFAARPPHGWNHVVELAETLGASVWDVGSRLNFPSDHPLNLTWILTAATKASTSCSHSTSPTSKNRPTCATSRPALSSAKCQRTRPGSTSVLPTSRSANGPWIMPGRSTRNSA